MELFVNYKFREDDVTCNPDSVFLYGTSRCNQRIESWWGILRKEFAQFWMNVFESFKDDGYYSGDYLDQELIRFCFLEIIQVIDNIVKVNLYCIQYAKY